MDLSESRVMTGKKMLSLEGEKKAFASEHKECARGVQITPRFEELMC